MTLDVTQHELGSARRNVSFLNKKCACDFISLPTQHFNQKVTTHGYILYHHGWLFFFVQCKQEVPATEPGFAAIGTRQGRAGLTGHFNQGLKQ
ncbi:hypothetical protein [Thalassospira sp.]|uniref:hypothetical protein n=1 Tax=Thalassospira sp. TaxID=1912094 RepID=UPI003AA9AD7A